MKPLQLNNSNLMYKAIRHNLTIPHVFFILSTIHYNYSIKINKFYHQLPRPWQSGQRFRRSAKGFWYSQRWQTLVWVTHNHIWLSYCVSSRSVMQWKAVFIAKGLRMLGFEARCVWIFRCHVANSGKVALTKIQLVAYVRNVQYVTFILNALERMRQLLITEQC